MSCGFRGPGWTIRIRPVAAAAAGTHPSGKPPRQLFRLRRDRAAADGEWVFGAVVGDAVAVGDVVAAAADAAALRATVCHRFAPRRRQWLTPARSRWRLDML